MAFTTDNNESGHYSPSLSIKDDDSVHHLSPILVPSFVKRQRLQLPLALPNDGDNDPSPSQCQETTLTQLRQQQSLLTQC